MKRAKVSKRGLVQRICRRLEKDGGVLKAARGKSASQELGDYFIVDSSNKITAHHIELEDLGRKLGVLKPYEELEEK